MKSIKTRSTALPSSPRRSSTAIDLENEKTMADCLAEGGESSVEEALKALSDASDAKAMTLADDLLQSLKSKTHSAGSTAITESKRENIASKTLKSTTESEGKFILTVPACVLEIERKRINAANNKKKKSYYGYGIEEDEDRLESSLACCESILSSLGKVASGGSQASLELRALEDKRRSADGFADDITAALKLRQLASVGADALGSRRYADAAKAMQDYKDVHASDRALRIAGEPTRRGYERTRSVLQRAILERYRTAVGEGDIGGISDLTPLLSMLDLENDGVGLYLRYSQGALNTVMTKGLEEDSKLEQEQQLEKEEELAGVRLSRAEQKRRQERAQVKITICTKLAKIYNAAVTHLRHHLPMVAYALGGADGDAALVQLVHLEVEKRAVEIIKDYCDSKNIHRQEIKADKIAKEIENRYVSEDDDSYLESSDLFENGDKESDTNQQIYEYDDFNFQDQFGGLSALDSSLEEAALLLQHTESYERFIRHAVDEVNKARKLRAEQKKEQEEHQQQVEAASASVADTKYTEEKVKEKYEEKLLADILPAHTQLNESISEFGGYYSVLERTLLLAGLQRAIQLQALNANNDMNYSSLSIVSTNFDSSAGSRALQTSMIEECFYAVQRSTLRAFATGHFGTASAAANYSSDIIGRVLYEVLLRRAHHATTQLLKPGEGLVSAANAATAAINNIMSTAHQSYYKQVNKKSLSIYEQKQRVQRGIARACASINDLEVAAEYSKRLEEKLLKEVDETYPKKGHETDQIRMCIKSLVSVTESYSSASLRAVEQLVSTLLPLVRNIIHDAVGQESTTGFSLAGGASNNTTAIRMNYNLDDDAYEMAQISEGYINRMCSSLDDTFGMFLVHLAPHLADILLLGVIGAACKRLESSIRRVSFT